MSDGAARSDLRPDPAPHAAAVAAARSPPPAFAALDLGTNNCRLMVGTPAGTGFRVLDSFSRTVRLGEGLHNTGRLSRPAMDRALAALHGCAARLGRRPVRAVHAIATEACRQAANGSEFLDRARRETGLPIAVITPREEAQLALESCAPLLCQGGRRALLFDIGGGSTELAWVRLFDGGRAPELIGTLSMPIGVVTLAERFGTVGATTDGFHAAAFHTMVAETAARLRPFEATHRIAQEIRQGGVVLLGTSGTVTTLAGIALDLPRYTRLAVDGTILTRAQATDALLRLRDVAESEGQAGLRAHACIGPDRAEFVLPGCAIYAAIHELWPADQVVVADRGLREGMLLRMIRREQRQPRRRRTEPPAAPAAMPAEAAPPGSRAV